MAQGAARLHPSTDNGAALLAGSRLPARHLGPLHATPRALLLASERVVPVTGEAGAGAVRGVKRPLELADKVAAHLLAEHLDRVRMLGVHAAQIREPAVAGRDVGDLVEMDHLERLHVH